MKRKGLALATVALAFITVTPGCKFNRAGISGTPDTCGNGVLDDGELCDEDDLDGQTCVSRGFVSGTLGCTTVCTFDTSGCEISTNCGNNIIDTGETCDGADLGGQTCTSQGFGPGTLACAANCASFDTSGCGSDTCGNGQVEPPEQCDGTNLDSQSCQALGYDHGNLACLPDCTFDETGCTMDTCGNGNIDPMEDCDLGNLNNQTCQSRGHYSGQLACDPNCHFDISGCLRCGDGTVNGGVEQCDGGDLNGQNCQSLGHYGGQLFCYTNCQFDINACQRCGDGIINGGGVEDCDGSNLNSQSCQSLGHYGGQLFCYTNCRFDINACQRCGDGTVNGPVGVEDCDGGDLDGQTCMGLGFDGGTLDCTAGCAFDTNACFNNAQGDVGDPCTDDLNCLSDLCLLEADTGIPGGMCTTDCDGVPCGAGQQCMWMDGDQYCFLTCTGSGQCRDDFACFNPVGSWTSAICHPHCTDNSECAVFNCNLWTGYCEPVSGSDADNGAACSDRDDCKGSYCFGVPGGYCTSWCSVIDRICPGTDVCIDMFGAGDNDTAVCLKSCSGPADCRTGEGYQCDQNPWEAAVTQTVCFY
jgi:hypothetical protein